MTPEQNAAIDALKADVRADGAMMHSVRLVLDFIDEAIEISQRPRVGTEIEVERVARALYELDPVQGQEHDTDHRPIGPAYTVTWEMLAEWEADLYEAALTLARAAISAMEPAGEVARPLDEWTEEDGDVLWWKFPVEEAPWVGTPLDFGQSVTAHLVTVASAHAITTQVGGWPGYHTHWTPLPKIPAPPIGEPANEVKP